MKFSTTLIRSLKCSTVILGLVICFSFWHSDYLVAFTNSSYANEKIDTPVFGYKIVNTYPHNTNSFTQGLIFDKGVLYESTGLNGRSAVKIVDLKTGKTLKSHELPDNYFGEGIAIIENKIIQLTWRSKTGFVYDKKTLKLIKKFSYQTQGWGITYDGKYLIISDGSAVLYFMDPNTFKVVGTLEVYANIWGTEKIAKINPKNGRVTAWIDLSRLLNKEDKKNRVDVLNGIAFNSDKGSLFVTGKLWPKMFEIELVPKN